MFDESVFAGLDEGVPPVVAAIRHAAARTPGVAGVARVSVRSLDERHEAEVILAVDGAMTVAAGYAIAVAVRGELLQLPGLAAVSVHVEPLEAAGAPHSHDGHHHEPSSYDGHRHDESGRQYYGTASGTHGRTPDIGHSH